MTVNDTTPAPVPAPAPSIADLLAIYRSIQAEADAANAKADASLYALEYNDMVRKAQLLNIAASHIWSAIGEVDAARSTYEQRHFARGRVWLSVDEDTIQGPFPASWGLKNS